MNTKRTRKKPFQSKQKLNQAWKNLEKIKKTIKPYIRKTEISRTQEPAQWQEVLIVIGERNDEC